MVKMTAKRLVAGVLACSFGLTLGACASTSDFVSDHWPHFAGGEPNDVPPRPGSPGYRTYTEHGQPAEGGAAPAASAQPATGAVTPEFAARQSGGGPQQPPAGAATAPAQRPASAAPPPGGGEQNVGQGGLY